MSGDASSAVAAPAAYSEQTKIFALIAQPGRFVSLVEPVSARQWVYAFTSLDRAKDFVRVMCDLPGFPSVERVLPCALGEWFAWQPKKHLPDLAIDPDPHALAAHPLHVAADTANFDVQSVVQRLPGGIIHRVTISPRESAANGSRSG